MKVKEVIEFDYIDFLKSIKEFVTREFRNPPGKRDVIKRLNEIISLLQQGEKYRQMWKCLKEQLTYSSDKENLRFKAKRFLYLMKCFEQKYFPKEEKENEESKIT